MPDCADAGLRRAPASRGAPVTLHNVFIERLWRSVKYKEVYLKDYATAW